MKSLKLFIRIIYLPFWYLLPLLPRNKRIWLFGAHFGNKYGDNSRAIFEHVLKYVPEIRAYWITRNKSDFDQLLKENRPVVMAASPNGAWLSLRAGVVFITSALGDMNAPLIKGSKVVVLWHGLMMKVIREDAKEYRYEFKSTQQKIIEAIKSFILPYYSRYKPWVIINTASFFTPYFCSAFKVKDSQVKITGYPRNDLFKSDYKEQYILSLNEKFNNPFKILYLPTWRDAHHEQGMIFRPFNDFGFDKGALNNLLLDMNAVFISKGHYLEHGSIADQSFSERFINITDQDYSDLYLLMKDVDLLITDYSSVYFDFLLLNKPIILAPFDYEEYINKSRNLYYNYYEQIEGVKAKNWPELFEILKHNKYFIPSGTTLQRFHKFTDGNSCQRVANEIKAKLQMLDK